MYSYKQITVQFSCTSYWKPMSFFFFFPWCLFAVLVEVVTQNWICNIQGQVYLPELWDIAHWSINYTFLSTEECSSCGLWRENFHVRSLYKSLISQTIELLSWKNSEVLSFHYANLRGVLQKLLCLKTSFPSWLLNHFFLNLLATLQLFY